MERRLKERLIGAAVLVMMAVILIPMVLDDTVDGDTSITRTNIPPRTDNDFNSRIIPLEETDLEVIKAPEKTESNTGETVSEEQIFDKIISKHETQAGPGKQTDKTSGQPEKEPVGLTAWVVQLGSFSSEVNANALNDKLRKSGFPAFVEPIKKGAEISYRVRVGPELLRSDAQILQQKINKALENEGIKGIVLRYP